MKKSILLLLLTIFTISLAACQDSREKAVSELKQVSADLNRNDMPITVDELTMLTSTEVTPTDWVYIYTVNDGGEYDGLMEELQKEENKALQLQTNFEAMKEQFNKDSDVRTAMTLVKAAGLGVLYRYVGSASGKTVEVRITPEEVANL